MANKIYATTFMVSIFPEEKRKLEELAKRETRTMSGMIRHLVNQEYERQQHEMRQPEPIRQ